ncbi:MAG: type IX secretion system membrane protein PorP/SprF [Crocinitomicaceae bacterium]|nr:type IX secretion system membrane protein PorP/SprF [Crocinitomicaceae bacterium]
MRIVLIFLALQITGFGFSQQTEHYTQYEYNQFAFNPAVAGTKACIDIRSGYRFQWVGIEGAPQTGFLNAHAPLYFSKKKRNAFGPKHGIGGMVIRDAFGPFSFLQLNVAYALHLPVSRYGRLSFGFAFGFKQTAFSTEQLTTELQDPTIPNSGQSYIMFPDARLGVWYRDKKQYAGLSVHNLFGNRLQTGDNSALQRHFYITAGKSFRLEKGWSLIPSFFVLKTARTPMDFHLSALLDLENKFAFGLGLRRTDAITTQVRVKLFNFISIGYSFDFIISKLSGSMWQTHEITGGFNSCSNYGSGSTTDCPTFE